MSRAIKLIHSEVPFNLEATVYVVRQRKDVLVCRTVMGTYYTVFTTEEDGQGGEISEHWVRS